MPTKMFITDKRMLQLMDYVIGNGIRGIHTMIEFCELFGKASTMINAIKDGRRSFTVEQIHKAATYFNVDVNWIFGLTDTMQRKNEKKILSPTPITLLENALAILKSKK